MQDHAHHQPDGEDDPHREFDLNMEQTFYELLQHEILDNFDGFKLKLLNQKLRVEASEKRLAELDRFKMELLQFCHEKVVKHSEGHLAPSGNGSETQAAGPEPSEPAIPYSPTESSNAEEFPYVQTPILVNADLDIGTFGLSGGFIVEVNDANRNEPRLVGVRRNTKICELLELDLYNVIVNGAQVDAHATLDEFKLERGESCSVAIKFAIKRTGYVSKKDETAGDWFVV